MDALHFQILTPRVENVAMPSSSNPSFAPWARLALVVLMLAGVGAGGWYAVARGKSNTTGRAPYAEETKAPPAITAEVTHPMAGGIQRVVVQPGTIEPIEAADLYAKVSGYLIEQKVEIAGKKYEVDIGTPVKAGDILARISVPEYEKQVQRDTARLKATNTKVAQMTAYKTEAEAEARAADSTVTLATVMVRSKKAYREYREKRLKRVKELVAKNAVDEELRDEQEDYYQSALEAENGALEKVNEAKERVLAARAKILRAQADLEEAQAEVGVAEADLAKSRVLLDYTVIRSPYTGVVTRRTFHPGTGGQFGAFIIAADQGGAAPLLTVERTDVMRVVVQVPDRDVPFVSVNATAVVEIDALPGVKFGGPGTEPLHVARWARAEDPVTRTMRTEIDVKNPNGVLSHGMYGRVTLILNGGTPNAVRIPSAALVGKAEDGHGSVRVVRDGKVHIVPVTYATDTGVEAEIVSGLTTSDQVIVRTSAPVEEGTQVTVPANGSSH
jgi:RND family efflux transporter MFP subunit